MASHNYSKFLTFVEDAALSFLRVIKRSGEGTVVVVTHYDADGLAAGGIIAYMLKELSTPFIVRVVDGVTEHVLKELRSFRSVTAYIFLDMGSGSIKQIVDILGTSTPIYILDHHKFSKEAHLEAVSNARNIVHVNPYLFDIDGSRDISASGIAYFFASYILERKEKIVRFTPVALAGALGDRQDVEERRRLRGLNKEIFEIGSESGYVRVEEDLVLYGCRVRPLCRAIVYSLDIYIPEVSDSYESCIRFLREIGIEPFNERGQARKLIDLSFEEKKTLLIRLIEHLSQYGIHDAENLLVGAIYLAAKEPEDSPFHDLREFATSLNACGRMYRSGLGILAAMGYRSEVTSKVVETYEEYRRALGTFLKELRLNPRKFVRLGKHHMLVKASEPITARSVGAIASILSSTNMLGEDKVIAVYREDIHAMYKVSLRKPRSTTKYSEVDLAKVAEEVAARLDGVGGGHSEAAGMHIPLDRFEDLPVVLDNAIEEQVGGSE